MVTSLKGKNLLPERANLGANSFLQEKSLMLWENSIYTFGDLPWMCTFSFHYTHVYCAYWYNGFNSTKRKSTYNGYQRLCIFVHCIFIEKNHRIGGKSGSRFEYYFSTLLRKTGLLSLQHVYMYIDKRDLFGMYKFQNNKTKAAKYCRKG